MAVLPIVVGLAWLSWRFIEEPFRDRNRVSTRRLFAMLVPSMSVAVALGLVLHFSQGFPQRVFPHLTSQADVYVSYNERVRALTIGRSSAPVQPDIVVVGDSFGRDAVNALLEADPNLTATSPTPSRRTSERRSPRHWLRRCSRQCRRAP